MNKDYTISLELARELNKAGWKKDTGFWYVWRGEFVLEYFKEKCEEGNGAVQAPLATEILEELQNYLIQIETDINNYRVIFDGDFYEEFNDESLCDALAKLWICLKNKVIKSDL